MNAKEPATPACSAADALPQSAALAQGDARFRLAVEAAPNAMVMVNAAGEITLVNQQTEKLFGYRREQLLGRKVELLIPERNRGSHPTLRHGYLSQPEVRPMGRGRDLCGLTSDGREFPVEIGLNPLQTEDGSFVLASIIDITERKRLEERFHLAVEAAPYSKIMVNAAGAITLVNRATELMFGYPREELLGQTIELLVPDRIRGRHPQLRKDYFAQPSPRAMGFGRHLTGRAKDGHEFPIEIGLNPLHTGEGSFVLASIVDITERKRAEEALRALNASLEAQIGETKAAINELRLAQSQLVQAEKLASLGGLVAGIAHEINTPIGVGVTAASHLDAEVRELQRAAQAGTLTRLQFERALQVFAQSSDIILLNLRRAAELIQSFKRVAADQSSEERRHIHLRSYLEEVLTSLRPKFKHTPHRIELNCPGDLELDTVPGALSQLLTNLVVNALIHGFEAERAGCIRIDIEREGELRVLRFSDNGRGIPPENLPKIFDPFFTTRRGQGGTGLGLHIVFNIVHQTLGGTIAVDSRVGEGTCFTIRF